MKNWKELSERAQMEIDQWFPKQCRNEYTDYYWYYIETTPEHDGGFLICENPPANPEYKLAMPEKLGKHLTKDQNLYRFLEIARRLPVLSQS